MSDFFFGIDASKGYSNFVMLDSLKCCVEDDFQLICFDMVSEPSTPGAFMMKEAREYKNTVFTKADRINRLLNEVLNEKSRLKTIN